MFRTFIVKLELVVSYLVSSQMLCAIGSVLVSATPGVGGGVWIMAAVRDRAGLIAFIFMVMVGVLVNIRVTVICCIRISAYV